MENNSHTKAEHPKCGRCNTNVYQAESISMAGKEWHRRCFSCADAKCRKKLESTTCCDAQDEIWCKSCYAKRFGPKGYGYGLGAGALRLTKGHSGEINQAPKIFLPTEKGDFKEGSCHKCGHPVFEAEKMNCSSQVYHKQCFSCFECGIQLESTTVNDHEYGIYCGACYAKKFGAKGYGYGLGAGALKFTGK
ncbi:cysteine and glycine-rich protein 3-like [Actinia tenebrosa]|uniref:Cysteine and glycine-rich protein 3-like n=1 Tax=Actinia tenebrosa TaxID=6105 RepID=A0A6P8IXW5_ACTTE|nr:cysteine and glycine-rich protein 3-like [Actinia tenebrosa]